MHLVLAIRTLEHCSRSISSMDHSCSFIHPVSTGKSIYPWHVNYNIGVINNCTLLSLSICE